MLDGGNDYIQAPSGTAYNLGNSFAVEYWVNFASLSGVTGNYFIQRGSGATCDNWGNKINTRVSGPQTIQFYSNKYTGANPSTYLNTGVEAGKWYHVVWTYNGTTLTGYLNGVTDVTKTASFTINSVTAPLLIGSTLNCSSAQTAGVPMTIDALRIYSRPLTVGEVLTNYSAGNIEFQTRSGSDATPNDGSGWEDWKPITNEIQLLSLDSDAVNWTSSNSNTLSLSNDSVTKVEGTGSLKATIGAPVVDTNTVALWHFDETSALLDATVGASSGNPGLSCLDILGKRGTATDGVYWIQPTGETSAIQVNCNMTRDGGGWTLGLKSWYQAGGLFGNTAAVGVVTDATTLKGNAYKLSDGVIRNLIGPCSEL